MKIHPGEYRVRPGKAMDLRDHPTSIAPLYASEKDYGKSLKRSLKSLAEAQQLLYAAGRRALLVIFQGMDAAGKDSAIKHVMSGIDPQGCQVFSFKKPGEEELKHDFLWRTTCRLPERGKIGIFNRSYYEEVLVVKVHPEYLEAQGIPASEARSEAFWKGRYRSILDSESHLHRNGIGIVKFFLHLSKEEQRKRLLARLADPAKLWKFNAEDLAERERWDQYMKAYGRCLSATSTEEAPWYAVPADDKWNARLIISGILTDTVARLDLRLPSPSKAQRKTLEEVRKKLAK